MVSHESTGEFGCAVGDEVECATLEGESSSCETIVRIAAGTCAIVEAHGSPLIDKVDRTVGVSSACALENQESTLDLDATSSNCAPKECAGDGERSRAVFIETEKCTGFGIGNVNVTFGIELKAMRARRGDHSCYVQRASSAGTDCCVKWMRNWTRIGVCS